MINSFVELSAKKSFQNKPVQLFNIILNIRFEFLYCFMSTIELAI